MIALATTREESSWFICLLSGIPLWEETIPTELIHCDSITTIEKIENCYYNGKKKHQIRMKHKIIRDCISKEAIRVDHVHIDENLVDLLTKGLAREKSHNTS